jgi:branched-chain amino acid transport system ATP-binding protein
MTVLTVKDVSVDFGALRALKDVTFTAKGPSRLGLIGPNGAGKTTMLNAIAGFVPVTRGTIEVDGQPITDWSIQDRVKAGLMRSFQTARLLEEETVETNVLLGCQPLPGPGSIRQLFAFPSYRRWNREAKARTQEALELVGLMDVRRERVSTLTSGTRRLVEVARVLVAKPRILLLDEPAAGLDFGERRLLEEILLRVSSEQDVLMMLIEHDVSIVRTVCEYTFVLAEGTLLAEGPTSEVLDVAAVRAAYFGEARDA